MTELEKSKAIIQYIADAKKTTPVELYTDEEIKNKLLLKSKLLNISYAEYLRLLIQDDEKRNFIGEIIEFKNVLRELKIELNYIGNNLNQLSKKVNSNLNVELDEVLKVQENFF